MRILVATDQPYWLRTGGAQQRIHSLLRGLTQLGAQSDVPVQIATFFLGDPADLPREQDNQGLVFCPRSQTGPWGFLSRLREQWLGQRNPKQTKAEKSDCSSTQPGRSLRLDDYRWPWVFPHLRKAVSTFQPDVILLEYITMAYLREAVDDPSIVWALDTHDRLAKRYQQFRESGQPHWLTIDEAEECAAWEVADLLIAIQSEEAQWMREAVPGQSVVVAGHWVERDSEAAKGESKGRWDVQGVEPQVPVFGFIASNNFPNQQGIEFLLTEVWPKWWAQVSEPRPSLLVAGSIGRYASKLMERDQRLNDWIRVMGIVDKLDDFYSQVDIVLNPVNWGTGLKIKTSEALAFGKPMITSRHSAGEFIGQECGIIVAETIDEWVSQLVRFTSDANRVNRFTEMARQYAANSMRCEQVYDALFQSLLQMVHAKRQD